MLAPAPHKPTVSRLAAAKTCRSCRRSTSVFTCATRKTSRASPNFSIDWRTCFGVANNSSACIVLELD